VAEPVEVEEVEAEEVEEGPPPPIQLAFGTWTRVGGVFTVKHFLLGTSRHVVVGISKQAVFSVLVQIVLSVLKQTSLFCPVQYLLVKVVK